MATSGSFDFKLQRDEIIQSALRKLGVLGVGESPGVDQTAEAAEALNVLVKKMQAMGIGLWAVNWVTEILVAPTERTGTDGEVYTCIKGHVSAAADRPITGADFARYWYKKGSTGGAWSAGATYTSIGDFALDLNTLWIDRAFIRRANSDHNLQIVAFADYFDEITKYDTGLSAVLALERKFEEPRGYLIPQPDKTTDVLHYLKYTKLQDMDVGTDHPDFPPMWLEVLIFGLAHSLSFEYPSVPRSKRAEIRDEARVAFAQVKRGDTELEDDPFMSSAYPER